MDGKRLKEIAAIVLIGDGMIGLFQTQRHMRLWRNGPKGYRKVMEAFMHRPGMTHLLSALEVGIGFYLAAQQKPRS